MVNFTEKNKKLGNPVATTKKSFRHWRDAQVCKQTRSRKQISCPSSISRLLPNYLQELPLHRA